MSKGIFEINGGSDLQFDFAWPDGAGGVVDLTDWTVSLIDVDPALNGHVTATKSATPTDGVITVRVEWQSDFALRTTYPFRVVISKDGDDSSTNLLAVVYS